MAEWIDVGRRPPKKGRDVFIILDTHGPRYVWIGRRTRNGWDILDPMDGNYDPDHPGWNRFVPLDPSSQWSVPYWKGMPKLPREDRHGL